MTRRQWVTLAVAVALLVLVAYAARLNARLEADMGDLVEIPMPRAQAWWAATARCLGDPAPYPTGTRFFTGTRIPATWVQRNDGGKTFAGYSDSDRRMVAVQRASVNDSGLVSHELWHIAHGAFHPVAVFGDRTHPPRCGLAAP